MTVEPGADRIPISALQHFVYCPRQCALIHVEQTFDENLFTLRGRRTHENVHEPAREVMDGERHERSLWVWSDELGLTGKADLVIFPQDGPPYPIEYKAGARKQRQADEVQLCAQALCLEEMLDVVVPEGAIYHAKSRRRREITFNDELRNRTGETVKLVKEMLGQSRLPAPVADERCPKCSLIDACQPFVLKAINDQESEGSP